MAFALLSRLRYLNLKNNCLTVFPDVVSSPTVHLGSYRHTVDTTPFQAHSHAFARDSRYWP